jgi:hypothetical protein
MKYQSEQKRRKEANHTRKTFAKKVHRQVKKASKKSEG